MHARQHVSEQDERHKSQATSIRTQPNALGEAPIRNLNPKQQAIHDMQRMHGNAHTVRHLKGTGAQTIQRAPAPSQAAGATLEGSGGKELSIGQAGYTPAMLAEADWLTANAGTEETAPIAPASINYAQHKDLKTQLDAQMEGLKPQWEGMSPVEAAMVMRPQVNSIQNMSNALDGDKIKLQDGVQKYNSWTTHANLFYASKARLNQMQALLQVESPAAMAATVQQGLVDATSVAGMQDTAVQAMEAAPNTKLRGESLALSVEKLTNASNKVQTSWSKWRTEAALPGYASAIDATADDERARLQEIHSVEARVGAIGSMIDSVMAAPTSAMGMIQPWQNLAESDGDNFALAKQGAALANTQTANLDVSSAKAVSQLAVQALYRGESKALEDEIEAVTLRANRVRSTADAMKKEIPHKELNDALREFATAMTAVKETVNKQREDYLQFGRGLDIFSTGSAEAGNAGLAAGKKEERYTLIMAVAAQIAEASTFGNSARKMMPAELLNLSREILYNRAPRDRSSSFSIGFTPDETTFFAAISSELRRFGNAQSAFEQIFGQGKSQSSELNKTQMGGSGEY